MGESICKSSYQSVRKRQHNLKIGKHIRTFHTELVKKLLGLIIDPKHANESNNWILLTIRFADIKYSVLVQEC